MAREVERFIRLERKKPDGWHIIPLGERVRLWEVASASSDTGIKLTLFHIAFMEGVVRDLRVTYLSQKFRLLEVSDSKRLVGLELKCEPLPN